MARRTKEEAEQTRKDILHSALDIFVEKGYSKTTFDEIAKRINLTKGAVYWHFRNKPDIIAAMIKEVFYLVNTAIRQKIPEVETLEDLRRYFLYDAELIEKNNNYRKFLFFVIFQMEWSETIFLKISSSIAEIRTYPFKIIKQALTNAQKSGEMSPELDIDNAVIAIFSLWQGMLSYVVSNNIMFKFSDLFCKSFDALITGLKDKRS